MKKDTQTKLKDDEALAPERMKVCFVVVVAVSFVLFLAEIRYIEMLFKSRHPQ